MYRVKLEYWDLWGVTCEEDSFISKEDAILLCYDWGLLFCDVEYQLEEVIKDE